MTSHDADDLARILFQNRAAAPPPRIADVLVAQFLDRLPPVAPAASPVTAVHSRRSSSRLPRKSRGGSRSPPPRFTYESALLYKTHAI